MYTNKTYQTVVFFCEKKKDQLSPVVQKVKKSLFHRFYTQQRLANVNF